MKSTIILIILTLWSIFYNTTEAQNSKSIELYGIENGLSQGAVNCMIQDKIGIIWIGTQDGLNKYDGYKFRAYRNEPHNSNSIPSNYIRSLYEAKSGTIWISTQNGLSNFNPGTGNFKNYYNDPNDFNSLSSNDVQNVFEDKDGFVWVKSERRLDKLDVKTNKFSHYDFEFDEFNFASEYNYFSIYEDSDNILWVGTKDGLCTFIRKLEQFIVFTHEKKSPYSISNNEIRTIYEDKNRNLWIGTQNGLNLFNRKTKDFISYFADSKDFPAANTINTIFRDYQNNIWIGTEAGLRQFEKKKKKIIIPQIMSNDTKQIFNERITSIIEDHSNLLWISSWNGIYKLNNKPRKFQLYNKENFKEISDNNILSIFESNDGKIWLGTKYNGLNILDRKTKKSKIIPHLNPSKPIETNTINRTLQLKSGEILLATNYGIYITDQSASKFENYFQLLKVKNPDLLRNNKIYAFIQDSQGILWIATHNGLIQFADKQFYYFLPSENNEAAISSKEVYCLLEDKYQNIWIGTLHGLNKYDRKTGKFKHYKNNQTSKNSLSNNSILSLYEDSRGQLWVGTETGLNLYNEKKDNFDFFTQKDGFKSDYIYSILEDSRGFLWISTNHGIAQFDPLTRIILNYDTDDGLQGYEYNLGAYYKNKKGELFFGGLNGVNSFIPDSIYINQYVPKVQITKFETKTQLGKNEYILHDSDEIILNYNENNIYIEFATLEYTHSEKNQYKFILEGLETEWNDISTQHFATYSQLPSGTYTFKIKGANSDGVWNNESTYIRIIINPPIWRTSFAYMLYIIGIALSVYLIFLYITRNIRKENMDLLEKQKTAEEIARQKEELAIKNLNITDSIHYAKRIIEAMMPTNKHFNRLLPDSFVLYLPKDIVSGDFYWISKRDEKIMVATVDCTGHGVPGAFMSIIGFDLLRNITTEKDITHPNQILDRLNFEIAQTFKKDSSEEEIIVRDGMDMTLCLIDKKNKILEFSGAINPLYLIRNNNIIEFNADRRSVGYFDENHNFSFVNHIIPIEENDVIYMFSDGFSDQFGGPAQKKFKHRRFRHLLLTIHQLPLEKQKETLQNSIMKWKGELEQVDDILIIGIKPLG